MVDFLQIIYGNYIILTFAVGLLIIILASRNIDKYTNSYFVLIIISVIVLTLVDTCDYWISQQAQLHNFRYVTSAIGYVLRPLTVVFMINILMRRHKYGFVIWIPIIILMVFAFTNSFTHIMFYFSNNNYFYAGPLHLLPHAVSLFYLILMIFLTFKVNRYIYTGEIFIVLYVAVLSLASYIIEADFDIILTLPASILISSTMYYIFLSSQANKYDVLTGLLNRATFFNDAKRASKGPKVVISIDMNDLKKINDSFGHRQGDIALEKVANALRSNCMRNLHAYRIGGDEFMMLGQTTDVNKIKEMLDNINLELAKDNISIAYGYAFYLNSDNFEESCNLADSDMYKHKKQLKQELN